MSARGVMDMKKQPDGIVLMPEQKRLQRQRQAKILHVYPV